MSSSSAPPISLGNPPSDKLTRKNYLVWRSLVLPAIRGAQLGGLLDGSDAEPPKTLVITPADPATNTLAKTAPNPDYSLWVSRDQIVLSYLLQSLSPEVLPHVHRIENSAGVWKALTEMFSAQRDRKSVV